MVGPITQRNSPAEDSVEPTFRRRFLRGSRRVLAGLLWGLAGLVLLLAIVFLLAPARSAVLGWGLGFVEETLPGRLTVGEAKWPDLGRLVLKDVLWVSGSNTAPGDTLADVAIIDLELDLGALRERDGRVHSLSVEVRNADVPFIVAAVSLMADTTAVDSMAEDASPEEEGPPAEIPFLSPGSLPGVPSVALDDLDLEIARIRIAPGIFIRDLALSGRADAGQGSRSTAFMEHVEARFTAVVDDTLGAPLWEVDLDHLGFGLSLEAAPRTEGGWNVGSAALDSLQLKIAPTNNPGLSEIWSGSDPVTLKATARLDRDWDRFVGELECDFVLPGSARFHPWLPDGFPHDEFGSVVGRLGLEGTFVNPEADVELRLDLGSSTWVEKGVVDLKAGADVSALKHDWLNAVTVRLDTLDIQLDGIRASGTGDWGGRNSNLELDLGLTDVRLPALFLAASHPELVDLVSASNQVRLDASARLDRQGELYSGGLECDFDLPGAAHFKAWLPEEFPFEEFDQVTGNLALQGQYESPRLGGDLRFDIGSNTWADRGLFAGAAEVDLAEWEARGLRALTASLDTLEIDLEGLRVSSSGALGPGLLALDFEGDVTDFRLPGLFVGPELSPTEIDLRMEVGLAGSLEEPEIEAGIRGGFEQKSFAVPDLAFSLAGTRQDVEASLRAGGGLDIQGTVLDSLRAEVRGQAVSLDSLSADFGFGVWERENSLALGGAVRGDTVRVVHIDSLVTRAFGRTMRNSEPFTFTLGPGPGVFELTKMEFVGEAGTVLARGFWNEDERDLETAIDLLLREEVLQEIAPSPMWSKNGGVDLKIDLEAELEGGQSDPSISGVLDVGLIPHREAPPLMMGLEFTSKGGNEALLQAELAVSSADTTLVHAHLDWPGIAGPKGGFWRPDPDQDLMLKVPRQSLNLERLNSRLPDEMVLKGNFDLAAEFRVFPPGKGEKPDSLAFIPLRGSVDAQLGIPKFKIDLPNRSWLETVVDAQLEGSLADPKLTARVEVTSGFIRIPQIPRNLHPVEGYSQLWALNDSLLASLDSTAIDSLNYAGSAGGDTLLVFRTPGQRGPALASSGPVALPEMDIEVVITDDVRIMGYGLDIKLLGGVKVTRGFDKDHLPGPSIKGDLKIREGNLKAMNRVFNVERGNIKFRGDVPPDPQFDLMLESQVNAYLVRVLISGRASSPVIELTSEPDLSEEDVMAVLLFGQPMNDLDNDQRGRMDDESDPAQELQRNLANLAMAFGARGLQEGMSDSFGVDMVQMGSDSSGGSTLMVGKFITPDIMLKYHQSLEKSGTYFMTLEYSLNRYFKLVTTYGQGEEASGGEVQWSRRY